MKDAAEAAGLAKMRRQQVTPFTIPAFEASEFAKEQDKFDDFHKAVFRAFWEEGRNIGVDDVLKESSKSVGWTGMSTSHREGERNTGPRLRTS